MAEPWLIRIYEDERLVATKECGGPLELGRTMAAGTKADLYELSKSETGAWRLVIAGNDEKTVSRQHARIAAVADRRIELTNLSIKANFTAGDDLGESQVVMPGQQCQLELPVSLDIGARRIQVQAVQPGEPAEMLECLREPTLIPSPSSYKRIDTPTLNGSDTIQSEAEYVIRWVKATMGVFQSAATDSDFFQKAAQAVVDVGHMDTGRILVRKDQDWETVACAVAATAQSHDEPPSRLVLKRACEEKRTFWLDPLRIAAKGGGLMAPSLAGVHAALASPILDRHGGVIAALYGERRLKVSTVVDHILSEIDAVLMDLLAGGVAAGLARVEQERKALGLLTQFEQFFTPDLARQLVAQPELLAGEDLEISTLFCDIQGFSRLSRDLGPAMTVRWVGDVLSTVSDCALNHQGVLIDYIGDALMAMWGAPQPQPDHPERACRAALEMLECLPALNARWQDTLREPMNLTIGINTGLARVGNTGSVRKFKYGPLGDTVNVASRVQGAAKYFHARLLLTKETRDRLGAEFRARRLGLVRVQNIADPIDLYELFTQTHPNWSELATEYEAALAEFEAGQFPESAQRLGRMINRHVDDGPTCALLARASSCMIEKPVPFDPAFRLPGK